MFPSIINKMQQQIKWGIHIVPIYVDSSLLIISGLLQRANADHELEIAILSQKLHSNEVIIQNSVEAGDVLIEDLDALKRQAKSLPCTLNWTKLKVNCFELGLLKKSKNKNIKKTI